MAQTGYTPIKLYASSTASAVPLAANLDNTDGAELAINITDGKLFYKDNAGVVQVIATKSGATGTVSSVDVSGGTTGLTTSGGPITTSGTITLAGTLAASNGGTGQSSYTTGDLLYASGSTALSKLAIGTTNYVLTSSGTGPQWSTNLSIGSLTASADSTFSSTGALTISKGTTAQQPGSPVVGMIRYNTTTNTFEGYSGASPTWQSIGGASITITNDTSTSTNLYPAFMGATSGTASTIYTGNANLLYKPSTGELQSSVPVALNGIVVNSATIAANYTIAAGYNGMSAGPVSINSGIAVTVSTGSVWTVV